MRFIGNVAQLSGYAIEVEKYPGGTIITDFRKTEIYAKEHGRWLAQASQVTTIPTNHAKPMTHEPEKIREFVGRYEWAAGNVQTITLRNGHLVADGSDPMFFTAPDSAALPDALGVAKFFRNRSGVIAGYVYYGPDGQTIRVKRLP